MSKVVPVRDESGTIVAVLLEKKLEAKSDDVRRATLAMLLRSVGVESDEAREAGARLSQEMTMPELGVTFWQEYE